jgi:hypothetical protein
MNNDIIADILAAIVLTLFAAVILFAAVAVF